MSYGWNVPVNAKESQKIVTDWDMSYGWNKTDKGIPSCGIVTDWDMSYGWNFCHCFNEFTFDCNRLGYELWLEHLTPSHAAPAYCNRLGYELWLEQQP